MIKKVLLSALLCFPLFKASGQTPVIAADINPGSGNGNPLATTAFNGNLYFLANGNLFSYKELWKFDGTTASKITLPNNGLTEDNYPFVSVNNKLFFDATNPTYTGNCLWYLPASGVPTNITDTVQIGLFDCGMAIIGQKIYFPGGSLNVAPGNYFYGLYSYDDANSNFQRCQSFKSLVIAPYDTVSSCAEMTTYNNKIYFVGLAQYELPGGGPNSELFAYDPSNGTTSMVTTYNPSIAYGNAPRSLHVGDDNKLYFSANTSSEGRELFVIDGNNAPQKLTALNSVNDGVYSDVTSQYYPKNIIKWGNYIYFSGNNGSAGFELMKLDVSNNNTSLVKNINASTNSSYPVNFIVYNNKLYFSANSSTEGTELWETDGTDNGTHIVADLNPGSGSSSPSDFALFNNSLYMNANDGISGQELYSFTAAAGIASVKMVKDISLYPNPASNNITIKLDIINPENLSIALTDATGKIAYSSPAQQCQAGVNTITVPVQQLPVGIYQYRIANVKNELIGAGNITRE